MLRFFRYIFTPYAIPLYLISVICLWTSALFVTPWNSILVVFGSGILITTLVTSILNFHFQIDIHRYFSIISGAERASLARIYEHRNAALVEINTEFEKARSNNIELLAISGTDFFDPKTPILKSLDRMSSSNSNVIVRILLLDPRSKHAIDRSLLEEGIDMATQDIQSVDYPNKKLCDDTLLSLRQLERLLEDANAKKNSNFKLEIRTYDTAPILLLAQVNSRVFVEQYHYGIGEEDRMSSLTKCLGKKVPVFEFSTNSTSGQLWISHFNYLWETSRENTVGPGSSQFLRKELNDDKCWLNVYEDSKNIAKHYLLCHSDSNISALQSDL